jgi:hypothetical protein
LINPSTQKRGGAAEHALHGFEIHAFAGDVGCFLVLLVDLQEARRLAGSFRNRLPTISFCSLRDLRHAPTRLRHHPVGVGLRLVDRALEICARRLHVTESRDHLRWRIDLL